MLPPHDLNLSSQTFKNYHHLNYYGFVFDLRLFFLNNFLIWLLYRKNANLLTKSWCPSTIIFNIPSEPNGLRKSATPVFFLCFLKFCIIELTFKITSRCNNNVKSNNKSLVGSKPLHCECCFEILPVLTMMQWWWLWLW